MKLTQGNIHIRVQALLSHVKISQLFLLLYVFLQQKQLVSLHALEQWNVGMSVGHVTVPQLESISTRILSLLIAQHNSF
jgi:hypothetical protein